MPGFKRFLALCLMTVMFAGVSVVYADGANPTFTAVSAGWRHTLALRSDGTVWSWGVSSNSAPLSAYVATQVPGLTGITAISAGFRHSIALKNGSVWYWSDAQPTPSQVSGLSNVKAIAAGSIHDVALKTDGTVWAWGRNDYGQFSVPGYGYPPFPPTQVSGLSGITAIAAGEYHSLALKNDGSVWAWGDDSRGQLGCRSLSYDNSAKQMLGLSNINAISAGMWHSFAMKNDGTIWAWGWNQDGQIGNGATIDICIPVQVPSMATHVSAIAGGRDHSVFLSTDGTVKTCGWNYYGQFGNGTTMDSLSPIQIMGLFDVKAVSAGEWHTVFLKNDGTVWGTGYDRRGQLGPGFQYNTPIRLALSLPTDATPPSTPVVTSDDGYNVEADVVWKLNASWNAIDSETGIYEYQFRIGRTPFGGSEVLTDWISSGSSPSASWAVYPAAGDTVCWYVRARNNADMWSDVGASDKISVVSRSLGKMTSDGKYACLRGVIITAVLSDCYYVEKPDRSMGTRVVGGGGTPAAGKIVDIDGYVRTNSDKERYIDAYTMTEHGTGSVSPIFAIYRSLGGSDCGYPSYSPGYGQFGVAGGLGPNNIGLLITISGKVTAIGSGWLYTDDGTKLLDGTGSTGVRVICDTTGHYVGENLMVTGISSCFLTPSTKLAPRILARNITSL